MATENANTMGDEVEWEPNEEGEDPKKPLPFSGKSELTTCKLYQVRSGGYTKFVPKTQHCALEARPGRVIHQNRRTCVPGSCL